MTRTPSDAARDGCGAEGEPAVEAALRIINADLSIKDYLRLPIRQQETMALAKLFGERQSAMDDGALVIAQHLLSLSSRLETAREEMKEEAAKAVEDLFFNPPRVLCADTLDAAANAVRSLSVK